MNEMPKVKRYDWVTIGKIPCVLQGVVSVVYEGLSADGGNIEVVYYRGKRTMYGDAKWTGTHWGFARMGIGCADETPRLASFVGVLRRGPSPKKSGVRMDGGRSERNS
jgi:hypothetical protein